WTRSFASSTASCWRRDANLEPIPRLQNRSRERIESQMGRRSVARRFEQYRDTKCSRSDRDRGAWLSAGVGGGLPPVARPRVDDLLPCSKRSWIVRQRRRRPNVP